MQRLQFPPQPGGGGVELALAAQGRPLVDVVAQDTSVPGSDGFSGKFKDVYFQKLSVCRKDKPANLYPLV